MSQQRQTQISSGAEMQSEQLKRTSGDGALMLSLFFGLGRTLQMVGKDNDTYQQQLEKFWEQAALICKGESNVTIKIVDGRFFINEQLCKFSQRSASALGSISHWNELKLGGIQVPQNPEEDSLTTALEIINDTTEGEESFATLLERFNEQGLSSYRLFSKAELREEFQLSDEERRQIRRRARSAFFQSVRTISEASARTASGRELQLRSGKRVVNTLIDLLAQDDSALIEMAAIKEFDDYTYAHSVNVCIYSLTIGLNIGLDQKRLSQLGFAALFHDLGKVSLPKDVVKKAGAFDDSDWRHMHKHPSLGARGLLNQFELETYAVRGAIAAYEHHMNLDLSGYPQRANSRKLNLFSRIITVADTFDALTSGRIYIKEKISPVEVMRRMLYQMNDKYDPLILKVFINAIGLFPPGSLILLSDKRIAIVERSNANRMDAPVVRIIGSESGLRNSHQLLDLSEPEFNHISIDRYLDAEQCNIDLKRFILEDPPDSN